MISLRKLGAVVVLAASTAVASAAGYSGLYIFGDSLSDSGNIAALIGSDPSQVITGNGYIPSRPYASGQFTNGNVWARTFATAIGLSAQPSLLGGTNYAFGGARTATDGAGNPPSLNSQTSLFLTTAGGVASGSGLYVIEGGGNDARDTVAAAAVSATPGAVIAAAAAAYATAIGNIVDRLQAAGAQNLIVWDVPNLALAPAITAQGAGATFLAGQVAGAMNNALSARLTGEVGVKLFDIFGLQNTFAANPAAYGFANVSDACGALGAACDPSKYLFWDGIHPTSAGHALIAQQMLILAVPEPGTYVLLIVGLLVVGWRVRRQA